MTERTFLAQLRPRVITGGWPAMPLALLVAVGVMDDLDRKVLGVLAPEIKDFYGLDIATVTTLLGVVGLVGIVLALPVGFLVDRVNRVRLAAIGMVILGAFSLLSAFAPVLWIFAAARAGAALGKNFEPASAALLADFYPVDTRANVYAAKELAQRVALMGAPIVAGIVASALFFQAVFVLLAIPAFVLAALCLLGLREPVRGAHERRSMGASDEVAERAQRPPSFAEGFRIAWNVRTLRRILYALPLLVGPAGGIVTLLSFHLQDTFNLGPATRGLLLAASEPFGIAGLVVGGAVAGRFLRDRPGRVVTYAGLMGALAGGALALTAVVPSLALVVAGSCIAAFAISILLPALTALSTLVVPARARGSALALTVVGLVPGAVVVALSGRIADHYGSPRAGMLALVPVFIGGALVLASAGSSVASDIRSATAAAMASEESERAKAAGKAKLLVVRDLDVAYDDIQVLFNVDFDVEEGEIIALLGTNGAGKSTLLRAISGIATPANGAIFFDGEDITYLPSSEHAARGIIQTPGGRGVFPSLTVRENLTIAGWLFRSDGAYLEQATARVLGFFPVLAERLDTVAGNLSGGEQQMLTLGQAFLSRPRLLMIDELSLGLSPAVVEQLLGIVRAIKDLGTTIVVVEQSVNVALTIADRAVFMEKGEIRFTGPAADLLDRPDVLRSVYLKGASGAAGPIAPRRPVTPGVGEPAVALELRGVSMRFGGLQAIDGVDLRVAEGQILGLIGPNGAGKTTLFDIISGFLEPDAGEVFLFGDDVLALSPDQRAHLGLQRSFQDARLFPTLTVGECIAVALERHVEVRSTTMAALHLPAVRRAESRLQARVDRLVELIGLGELRDKAVRELSTGSRRLVDLACLMAASPRVLLLDEPSSGIAQREAEELGPLLTRIKYETGATMLLIEHDMPLIMSVSDELVALEVGTVVTRGLPADVVEHPRVVAAYLGASDAAINRSGN